ncbi:cation diffusion facilitator family transporter [Defluviitalea saccharophila]|uniref:Cation diffusion facilitator family transporter n=1 Tax=Defluviitalea saccharophila TaxID=879970 RepID=A0ABZ2Y617_9FIRM
MNESKKIKMVLWTVLFANIAAALIKIAVGQMIKSASMTADGFHSFTDGTSNIVGLIGIHLAAKPRDEDHPYGHKKFENLAGLFISGMLGVISFKIVMEAFLRFKTAVTPSISVESLILLVFTLIVNIFVAVYEYKQGKSLKSTILISDSMHTRSDIFISIGVLLTLICIHLGVPSIIDPVVSIIVSGFIMHAAYEIFQTTCGPLLDQAIIDPNEVKDIVLSFDEVKDVHEIRSRGREDDMYIDLHICIDPNTSFLKSHELTDAIEKKLKHKINENMEVIIRTEPFNNFL